MREARLLKALAIAMKQAPPHGSFDEWMKRQSDQVQAAANAYAGEWRPLMAREGLNMGHCIGQSCTF